MKYPINHNSDQTRQHYEYALRWRERYHAEKRECNHKLAVIAKREFDYHNRQPERGFEMSEFTDYYRIQAANWYAKREAARAVADYPVFAHAEAEFQNYRKAAGLPEKWQPEDDEKGGSQ